MNEKSDMTLDSLITDLEGLRNGRLSPDAKERIWREAWKRSGSSIEKEATNQVRGFFASLRIPTLRLAVAFELILLLLLGSVGVIYAANQSVPGDVLYPVKRNTEAVWLGLTPERKQTDVRLALLERRVEEIQQLTIENQPIPGTLQAEVSQTFSDIAANPERWENAEALPHVKRQAEILAALSVAYPEVFFLSDVLQASLNAFEQLGGDVGILSIPPDLQPTPIINTPTTTPSASPTPTPTPTLTPSPSPSPVSPTPLPTETPTVPPPTATQPPVDSPPDDDGDTEDPADPADPEDPANPANTADPADPGEPGEPADPADPADPSPPGQDKDKPNPPSPPGLNK